MRARRSGSSNWQVLKMGYEIFSKGLRWVVNNGHHVSFWHDIWVGNYTLMEQIQGPLPLHKDSFPICDVIEGLSLWDFSKNLVNLPTFVSPLRLLMFVPLACTKINLFGIPLW